MPASNCAPQRHIWHVHAEADRLITANLRHGHRCQCGRFVIAQISCDAGCEHKRVLSKTEFDKLMEER